MTKAERGRLDKVNDSLNKPKSICGVDYRLAALSFAIALLVFLVGLKLASLAVFAGTFGIAYIITKNDDRMLDLWMLRRAQGAYYDPGRRRK